MDIRANVLVDTIALVIALVSLFSDLHWKRRGGVRQKHFRGLILTNCLVLFMDMLAWLCDGRTFAGARVVCVVTNTGYYAMQIVFCWLWSLFIFEWTRADWRLSRTVRMLFALPMLAELAVLVLNLFDGCVFVLDEANRYERGTGYLVNLIPFTIYCVAVMLTLLRALLWDKDVNRKRHSAVLLIGTLLPACGSIIESRSYGMTFTWPLAALSLLLINLSDQQEQTALSKAEAANAKAALAEGQMSIMLSQIQPHFLYNSLTVIAELCETDPATARFATMQFSAFLRGNMGSLTINRPIAFERELQLTRNYLALEELRFQDRLRTRFEIETTLFQLPTLTLQPIVENAVRYGVTKRPEGGTVVIAARETPDSFVVRVSDDGVGFDPTAVKDDGRPHIGIANVRDRLRRMVNGTLEITSAPDAGTVVVLTIPKGALPC